MMLILNKNILQSQTVVSLAYYVSYLIQSHSQLQKNQLNLIFFIKLHA